VNCNKSNLANGNCSDLQGHNPLITHIL